MKKYYIAYGSNLNVRQMKMRCPTAVILGTAVLNGWELLFKGSKTGSYLTIEKRRGGKVPVAIWEVTTADERSLDRYEGYPSFYYKKDIAVKYKGIKTGKQHTVTAFVYIMHEERPLGIPTDFYLRTCIEGYSVFGFDKLPLTAAYERSWEVALSLRENAAAMKNNAAQERTCPLCGQTYWEHPALSRADGVTLICPDCGVREALDSIGVDGSEREKIVEIIRRNTRADIHKLRRT